MTTETEVSLSRRSVLRLSFFSALGLAALGMPAVVRTSQHAVLEAVFDVILGVSSDQAQPVEAALDYFHRLPTRQQWQVKGLLRATEWGPVFSTGRRFTRLDGPARQQWLRERAESSSAIQRQIFTALKQLAAMGYYQNELAWDHMGYPGPLLDR